MVSSAVFIPATLTDLFLVWYPLPLSVILTASITAFLFTHSNLCFPIPKKDNVTVLIPTTASANLVWSLTVVGLTTDA